MVRELKKLSRKVPNFSEISDIVNGLEQHTDREVAILGSSILETCLEFAIISRFPKLVDGDRNRMFGRDGSQGFLSTLESRILFAHVLSVLSDEMRDDLTKIRHIRNIFAHSALPISFEHENISSLCKQLVSTKRINEESDRLPELIDGMQRQIMPRTEKFLDDCLILGSNNFIVAYTRMPQDVTKSAKKIYIETVQVIHFWLMCHGARHLDQFITAQQAK